MSISSSAIRKVGPTAGNGVTTAFPFTFKVFANTDLYVVLANSSGVETVQTLTSQYTVTLNSNQDSNPGGTVNMVTPPAIGFTLTLSSQVTQTQPLTLTNQGGFFPNVINDAFDRVTILIQQLAEQVSRSAKLPISSTAAADTLSANIMLVAADEANIDAVAANLTNINTVNANAANINTNAANIAAIQNASANANSASSSATSAASSAAAAAASAASGMYRQVLDKSANYTILVADEGTLFRGNTGSGAVAFTLPQISTTHDGFKLAVTKWTADANAVTIQQSGSDTIDGGSSITIANQYSQIIFVADFETNTWFASQSGLGATNKNVDRFSGNNSTTVFTLTLDPAAKNNTDIYISGVHQDHATYSVSGTTLTFNTAPPTGTNNIEVVYGTPLAIGTPSDATVSTVKLSDSVFNGLTVVSPANTDYVPIASTANSNAKRKALVSDLLALSITYGLFRKSDPTIVAWSKTGNFTVSSQVTLYVEINGVIKTIASGTAVSMPTATAGTDYAIWANPDGTLQATSNFTSPPVTGARKVGGFHYAPGGHSGSPGGGNTTPQINQYSFYDLKFRPECQDPRGMTLVAGGFWADIYLLGVDHLTNGTSKYNVTMADGASPPKIPSLFGGNGTTAYSTLTWWESAEVMKSWGKRLPRYDEFAALAYGTTEASAIGTDQNSTIWNAAYVSKWGCNQSTGVLAQWGADFGGGAAAAGWVNNTNGRGQTYQLPNAVEFGGYWGVGAYAGSRFSYWNDSPSGSANSIGARGVCDHVVLD